MWEERAAQRSCYRLTITPLTHPPAPLGGGGSRGVRNERVKLNLGRREGENGILVFVFVFHYPNLL